VFGHWSTLGPCAEPNVFPLDTGCPVGRKLTALRLDGPAAVDHIDCPARVGRELVGCACATRNLRTLYAVRKRTLQCIPQRSSIKKL